MALADAPSIRPRRGLKQPTPAAFRRLHQPDEPL